MIGRRWKQSNLWSRAVLIAPSFARRTLFTFKDRSALSAEVRRDSRWPNSGGETPVPIPNTAVKPARADGSGLVRARKSRSPPGFIFLLKTNNLTIHPPMRIIYADN